MYTTLHRYRELLATYLAPQGPRVIALALLLVLTTALQLWSPQLLRQFIDTASTTAAPPHRLLVLAGLFLAAALLTQCVQVGATYLSELVGWTATNRLRSDLARHCLRLDRAFHTAHTPGEMIERIDGDVSALAAFFSQLVLQVVGSILLVVGVIVVLLWESVLVGAVLTIFVGVVLVVLVRLRSVAVDSLIRDRESRATMFGRIEEHLAGLDDLRANGGGLYAMRRVDAATRRWMWITMRAGTLALLIPTSTMGLFVLGYAASLALGAYLYIQNAITIGTVFLFFQYTDLLRRPIEQLAEQIKEFQAAAAGIARIDELRALRPTIGDGPGTTLSPGALQVDFEHVRFAYERATTIDDLHFTIAPGRVLGVLGRTGSGKTTLTRLLFRLHDVDDGAIRLGGADVRDLTLRQLREHIGIVTQDVHIFEATLRDNLTMFDAGVSDERLLTVLQDLGLGTWARGLQGGLDHVFIGGTAALSAGEAQLIAFARVFLHDPGLVILDEASSRLDPATEHLIERAVDRLLAGRTAIVIAHRLGTIRRADDVVLLQEGRLLEYGERTALAADEQSRFAALLRSGMEEVLR